jgi:serine protease Do
MMSEEEHISELIDRYLSGSASPEEQQHLLDQAAQDPALAREIDERKRLLDALNVYGDFAELKGKLNEIHQGINVAKLKKETRLEQSGKRMPPFLTLLAVAASVSLLVVISSLYFSGFFNQEHADYTQLMNMESSASDKSKEDATVADSCTVAAVQSIVRCSGTCFALSRDGYLVTNYHLVKETDSVYITNLSEPVLRYAAVTVAYDQRYDIAILKIEDKRFNGFGKIPYTLSNKYSQLGEQAFTLGYSKSDIVFADGAISSLTGFAEDTLAYQVTIPVNPGNSGSPLIDNNGEILGIISGKHSREAGATYAIKSSYILQMIDQLKKDSLNSPVILPSKNLLQYKKRTEQVRLISPLIFRVEVY